MSTSFSFGMLYTTRFEQQSVGLDWDNIWISPVEGDGLNFATCCLILLFDMTLYAVVAIFVLLGKWIQFRLLSRKTCTSKQKKQLVPWAFHCQFGEYLLIYLQFKTAPKLPNRRGLPRAK